MEEENIMKDKKENVTWQELRQKLINLMYERITNNKTLDSCDIEIIKLLFK